MNAGTQPTTGVRGLRAVLAGVVVLAGTAAGLGWLYLLRDAGALRAGPVLPDALALERLAGGDGQPLLRVLGAFVPAGLCVALALRALTGLGRAGRALAAGLPAYVLLIVAGTASDAVTRSDPALRHVAAQPGRAAALVPALVLALCGAVVPDAGPRALRPWRPRRPRPRLARARAAGGGPG
jgi:hypothetical protein